ncbi:MAG: hypothetical protein IPO21_02420 [Bacteroidales bacterium]|nr:hypothetical protein [Bacteroidales bacterium]
MLSVFSVDAIHFANYLRTDYLIGFFVACTLYFAVNSKDKKYLYCLAFSIAGAISCKISALPLVVVLGVYLVVRLVDKTISVKHFLLISILFLLLLFVFQPYNNWLKFIARIFELSSASGNDKNVILKYNWGKNYYSSIWARFDIIFGVLVRHVTWPVFLSFVFLPFTKKYIKIVFPLVLLILLLTIPYLISNDISYYWFAPVFNLFRFLSVICIFSFIEFLFNRYSWFYQKLYNRYALFILALLSISFYSIYKTTNYYFAELRKPETNKEVAKKWLLKNVASENNILFESAVTHIMPQIYDPNNIKSSKSLSMVFIYNKSKNAFLNEIFEEFLNNYYYSSIGINKIKGVSYISPSELYDNLSSDNFQGYYYITSPSAYNRYLLKDENKIPINLRKTLALQKEYFSFMLSNEKIKSFNNGDGPQIQVYKINKVFKPKDDTIKGFVFNNKYALVDFKNDFTKSITIDIMLRFRNYPDTWTTIIGKYSDDKKNEFCVRVKNSDIGQWYFGDGNEVEIQNLKTKQLFLKNRWTRVTFVRDFENKVLCIYQDSILISKKDIAKLETAFKGNSKLSLFGNSNSTLDVEVKYLQLYDKAMLPNEIPNLVHEFVRDNACKASWVFYEDTIHKRDFRNQSPYLEIFSNEL